MYELVQIGEKSYYFKSPAKIGLYLKNEKEAYLIDSGNDKDAGKKILKVLSEKGWILKGILNTHSNADHIGGNQYIQKQTGCKIFSGGIEAVFTEHTILEPAFLYGGYPCKDLRHKFLMAGESKVTNFDDKDFPNEIEIIPLEGHFFNQVGFRIPDGTVFMADCVSSKETLNKYQIGFIYDVAAYIKTLDNIAKMQGSIFVPAHTEPVSNMKELAELNKNKVLEIRDKILEICREPKSFDKVLQELFNTYNLKLTFEQYALAGSTVRSYLSWLKDMEIIEVTFNYNMLLWKTVQGR